MLCAVGVAIVVPAGDLEQGQACERSIPNLPPCKNLSSTFSLLSGAAEYSNIEKRLVGTTGVCLEF